MPPTTKVGMLAACVSVECCGAGSSDDFFGKWSSTMEGIMIDDANVGPWIADVQLDYATVVWYTV